MEVVPRFIKSTVKMICPSVIYPVKSRIGEISSSGIEELEFELQIALTNDTSLHVRRLLRFVYK